MKISTFMQKKRIAFFLDIIMVYGRWRDIKQEEQEAKKRSGR
ncbi:hypothetical protein GKODMF_11320 [Candidatus Electrothrix gigas]